MPKPPLTSPLLDSLPRAAAVILSALLDEEVTHRDEIVPNHGRRVRIAGDAAVRIVAAEEDEEGPILGERVPKAAAVALAIAGGRPLRQRAADTLEEVDPPSLRGIGVVVGPLLKFTRKAR